MWREIRAGINKLRRILLVFGVIVVLGGIIFPWLTFVQVSAAQVTDRSLNISSGLPSQTGVSYTFSMVPATAAAVQSIVFQACTTAVGTCTAPTGLSFSGATFTSETGWTDNTDLFTIVTSATGACTPSASELCVHRTEGTVTNETGAGQRNVKFGAITNPSGASCAGAVNCTFFVRMTTYSDSSFATAVDSGTVASSTNTYFQINALIEEELTFCVGSTTINDATSTLPTCSSISGTSLNLGILNSSFVSISPVPNNVTEGGDGNNGVAELTTNSANGSTVAYDAIQQAGTNHAGGLRVAGATCNAGTVNTDQCINSIGVTSATLTHGTENFGFAIGGVNCSLVTASGAYTCNFANGSFNLDPTTNYACNGITNIGTPTNTFDPDVGQIAGPTACKYAWDETGTTQTIASSSGGVGGEGLILKFAATPNLVTPTGTYTAKADFVATPTY